VSTAEAHDEGRRDFLYIATGAVGAVGAASVAIPLIDQMNPTADVLALASIEVDLAPIEEGQSITVTWRGNPVIIRHRTAKEIEEAKATPTDDLPDPLARNQNLPDDTPATDENRVVDGKEQYLVQLGVCTHLGCVPLGRPATSAAGSARATARTTTPLAASARVRHLKTSGAAVRLTCLTPSSKSAEGALDHEQRSFDLSAHFRIRKVGGLAPAAAADCA
jgi:ubiquinol-cytochrome c reductase iron-sulfur subunit